jgi:hypothetical protein
VTARGYVVIYWTMGLAALGVAGCKTFEDLRDYCIERPWECGGARVTPTPTPSRPPVVIEPTPTFAPTPTPLAPTATPGPAPTVIPPTVTPAPAAGDPLACLLEDEVPAFPVPIWTGRPCRIRDGFIPIGDPETDEVGCIRNWRCKFVNERCEPGDDCSSPARRIVSSLAFGGPNGVHRCRDDEPPGPGFICDAGREAQDAYGRNIDGNGSVMERPEGDPDYRQPWSRASICHARYCAATPTPAPTVAGPTPTPTSIVVPMQPSDFRLNFVNGCDRLWYAKEQDGIVCGVCDSTRRFIATLKSGKRWGNACDYPHFRCAREVCDNATEEVVQAHRDTCELCACRDWDGPNGSRFETQNGNASVSPSPDNNFQARVCGEAGTTVEIRACLPNGAQTFDGLNIPGGPGCGPWKEIKFEVKP